MEYCASAWAMLAEHLSPILECYLELIELKVWKPICWRNSTKNALWEALFSPFYMIYCIYGMKYHDKWAKKWGNFAEVGKLLVYACGRIIQSSMSALYVYITQCWRLWTTNLIGFPAPWIALTASSWSDDLSFTPSTWDRQKWSVISNCMLDFCHIKPLCEFELRFIWKIKREIICRGVNF